MDLSKLSTADLEAFAAGDLAKVSTAGLERLLAPPVDPSKSGFIPAAKAGWENLKGDVAGLAGRTGIMGLPAAEKYQAERKADAAKAFSATQDDWSESPWLKFKETLGGSLPYMAAPVIAGGATAAAVGSAPVGLAALAPLAAAGLASGAQFTATNIGRQQEEGVRLQDTNLTNAMLAAAPQAALDMVGLGKIPGVRQLIGLVSKDIGKEAAVKIAGQSLQKIVADYAKATGTAMGAEGITEAGQQVFERMQAGLNLTDEKARKEYWDNFVGGAVLGGALAPAGRYSERGKEAGAQAVAADKLAADEALKTRTAKTAQDALDAADPVKAKETIAAFEALAQQRIALQQQIKKKLDPNSPTYAVDAAANKELQTQIAALKAQEKELVPGYRQAVKTAIDPNDFAMQQALAGEGIQPHGLKARSLYPEEHYAAPAAPETTPSALKYMTDRVEAAQANSPLPPSPLKLVQYLMQSVPMAKQVVALRQPIPGIPKQQSDLVLSSLVLHIKDAEKNARKENAAELEARTQDLKSTLPAEPEAPADTFTQDTEQRRQDIQDAQEAAAAQAEAQAQQDRAAALLSAQSAPAGGVPPVQGESELRSLVHRGAGMSTRSMEGRTIEDAQRDLDLARSRRDKAGIDAAIEEMRDFREKEKQAEAVPMGYITSQWRGDQPPDVAAHQDALIARRQGLTQLLMAKPGAREAAQGNLRSRIVTEIEAARGTQTTKAERQQIAALADPVIAKLLSLKKPTMTAAREAQAALDAIRNKFTVKNVYLPPTEPMGPREARGTELLREREAGTPNADLLALAPRRTFKPEAAPESDAPIVAKDDTQTAALQKEQQRIAEQLAAHDALIGKSGMTAAEERALSAGDISTTKGYSADDVAAAIARNNTERMDLQGRIDALTARANQATDPAEKADVQESLDQARADMPLLEAAQSLLIERTRALRRQGVMPAETPGLRTPEELKALQTRKQEIATQLSEAAAKKAAAEQAAQTAQRVAAGKEAIAAKNAATEKDVLAGKLQAGREELAALPGMSVTHEAAEKAARLIETGPAKIEHLRAKIADPEATKTTRDHDKHELKVLLEVLQLAHDVAVGKEGAMDAIEARIVDISDKIAAYQEQIDAGQPRKYRMDKIAELKRERAALRKSEKGTFNPPTKTPIVGTSRTRTLPEQLAAATDKYAAVQANPAAKAGDKKALENRVKQLQKEVTAAEDQRATDFLEKALALEQMGTTGKLPKGRISQASRSEITPGDTRTGTPESMGQVQRENALTGATDTITPKTGTRNPVTEERKVVETNRAVGKPEQEAANVIADQLGVSTPTKEKTPVAQLEELISIKQKLLAEKIDAKTVAEKRAAEQLRKNDENKLLTDEQRKEAAEEIEKRPVRIEKEIQRLDTELDRLAEEVAPLRDAEVAAAEMAKFKAGEAKATPQASVEDAKAAVAESTKKKQPKNTKKKGLSETAEVTAGAVEDEYADYDNVADDTFARSDDPFFSRGKTKDAHTADSLVEELKPSFGGQDVRKRIGVYDTVAAMLKAHPEYEGRIPADAKGFVDGTHAFLIAENIGKGEGLSVTVHEIGAHIGMRNLFGPALYKALVNATKNWAAKADGSLEAKIARAAKERVEAAGTAKHKYDDELLAHTIEEAMKAGVSPTKLSGKGPIGQFIGRIMQAMQKILQRYGIAPNSLNMQHLVDMAYGAAGKELGSNGPRHGGAKLFTYAGEKSQGADGTSLTNAQEMLEKGVHPAQVHRDTGWFVGADGKMRYEIDDSKSKLTLPAAAMTLKADDKYSTTLGAFFEHPTLYKAYPELADLSVEFYYEPYSGTKAWASDKGLGVNMGTMKRDGTSSKGSDDFHDSILHEIQHAIQSKEGFTPGSNQHTAGNDLFNPAANRAIAAHYDRRGDAASASFAREHAAHMELLYPAYKEAAKAYREYHDSGQYKKDSEAYEKASADYAAKREQLVVAVADAKSAVEDAAAKEKAAWVVYRALPNSASMAVHDAARDEYYRLGKETSGLRTKLHDLQIKQIRLRSPEIAHTFRSIDLMAAEMDAAKPLREASEKLFDSVKKSGKTADKLLEMFMRNMAYMHKYGEVEARDTGFRKDLTAEQRKETRPYLSQDVYKEELLFSRGNAAATTNPLLKPLANEPPPDKRGFFRKTFDGMGHKIAAGAFDMKDPVLRAMHAQATASGDWHSFYQAAHDMRKADMVVNIMKSILSYGAPELRKDAKGYHIFSAAKGVSGVDLFKLAEKVPGADGTEKFKQITRYMTALQGARLGAERVGMTKEEVRDILAHVAATPALKNSLEAFRDAYHEYNTKLVNAVRDTGEISAEKAREMLRHRDYAPKYRQHKGQIEMSVGDNRWESIGDIATTPFMHAFKGGEEAIMPINESIMYNTNLLVSMATTNMAKRNIAHVLMQAGLPAKKMFIRDGKAPTGKEYLSWKEHGAPKYLKIDTEGTSMDGVSPVMLAESIEGFHGTMPALVKASAKLGDLLRAGVTRSPMYTLRQLLKDPVGAASTSGVDANPLTAIARTAKQYAAAFTGGNAELEAVNRNALVQSNILTGDRDDMVKAATEYANGGSQSAYRKIMNFLDTGAANADAATRAMIYKDSTSRGLSELEASYRVMESMNFHKRGAWSSVQYLNRMIPFFNAGLQGLNVTYRAMRGDMPFNEKLQVKQRFVNNALLLAAGALAYAAIMDDDPEYKKLKASDKYGALHFRVPGSDALFKLPVGFQEVGLPWAVGQALFDTFADNSEDKQIVKALFKYAMGAVPGVSSAGVPQGLKQVLETATNTDFFSWNPIVPPRLENELPELQYTGTTPEVLKALGKLGISPIKAQHFLEGLFSRIATDVLHTADIAWESAVGDSGVEKTARTLKDMPFFSSAVQGTTSSAAKEDVYEWANKVKKVNDSFSDIKKKMDAPRIQEFAKEHRFELASAQAAGAYTKLMGELSTNIRQLDYIPKMSSEEKLQRKKKLEATQEVISQNYKKVMERIALNVDGT